MKGEWKGSGIVGVGRLDYWPGPSWWTPSTLPLPASIFTSCIPFWPRTLTSKNQMRQPCSASISELEMAPAPLPGPRQDGKLENAFGRGEA